MCVYTCDCVLALSVEVFWKQWISSNIEYRLNAQILVSEHTKGTGSLREMADLRNIVECEIPFKKILLCYEVRTRSRKDREVLKVYKCQYQVLGKLKII